MEETKIEITEDNRDSVIEALKAQNYVIKTSEDYQLSLNNLKDRTISDQREALKVSINEELKEEHGADYRAKMEAIEALGTNLNYKKQVNEEGKTEKAIDFTKRVITDLHTKLLETQALNKELEEGKGDIVLKQQNNRLKNDFEAFKEEAEKSITQAREDIKNDFVNSLIESAVKSIRFDEETTKDTSLLSEVQELAINSIKKQFDQAEFKKGEGVRFFKDGKVLEGDNLQLTSINDLIANVRSIKKFLPKSEQPIHNGGTQQEGEKQTEGKQGFTVDFGQFKNRDEVSVFLTSKGFDKNQRASIIRNSPNFNEIYQKFPI